MRFARAFVAIVVISRPLLGQAPVRLAPPAAVLEHEFTRISGVRELSDGRVLVSDGGDRSLWVADVRVNRTRRLGREGKGPGEYSSAGALFPLRADSTLLIDVSGGRYLVLAGDSIVETVAPGAPAIRAGARNPSGVDGGGHVIFTRAISSSADRDANAMPRLDSLELLRVARSTGAMDTLARLRSRTSRINMKGPADKPVSIEVVINPLASGDFATMFEDGWIAIARMAPYGIEWIAPTGERTKGTLPYQAPLVTEADKRGVLRRAATQNGTEPADPSSRDDWPERMPPFLQGALIPAASGDLWIRRTPVAGRAETAYDIVNRRGVLASRLTLPEGEHVVGVSRTSVYVVQTDADGIQRLRRHAIAR